MRACGCRLITLVSNPLPEISLPISLPFRCSRFHDSPGNCHGLAFQNFGLRNETIQSPLDRRWNIGFHRTLKGLTDGVKLGDGNFTNGSSFLSVNISEVRISSITAKGKAVRPSIKCPVEVKECGLYTSKCCNPLPRRGWSPGMSRDIQ